MVFLQFLTVFLLVLPCSAAQLAPSETRILLQVQQLLEYPPALQTWTNWTNFCYLPPNPSLTIVCTGTHVTELTVLGNKSSPSSTGRSDIASSRQKLSEKFSIDLFFTILTKLSSLKVLSLVSLGLWGPLPANINRFWSLEALNMSSNFISGMIPQEILLLTKFRSIVLADNLLHGTVPDLRNLTVLEELDLSSNLLGPQLPSFGSSILVNVTLRNNSFNSRIPLEFNNFHILQLLDISYNEIYGQIPFFLFSMPSIQYLNLAGNKLTGVLPSNLKCTDELGFVDLSHNLLIGSKLPTCLQSNSSSRFVFYSWNCLSSRAPNHQHPNSFCHRKALAAKPKQQNQKQVSNSKLGLSLGISGAILGGAGALGLLIFAVSRRVGSKSSESRSIFWKSGSQKASSRLITEARHLSLAMGFGVHGLPPYRCFYLDEIQEATNNFDHSHLLGEGFQGELYIGRLRDGSKVVLRCIKLRQKHSPQSILRHMELISKFRHRHLASILGHCIVALQEHPDTVETIFLVFEYVSNGTLRSHLADQRRRDMLKWPQRVAIAVGIAKGIQFLHTGIAPGSIGNDLKIENILLDENLTSKITGYNLPMPSMVGSESHSSAEDLPLHLGSDEHGEKQDIYQLGVILVEVITGKQITSQSELDLQRLQLEQNLADGPSCPRSTADPSIRGTYAYESLRTSTAIAINCLCKVVRKRPTIEDVLWHLQYSVQVQDGWTISGENLNS